MEIKTKPGDERISRRELGKAVTGAVVGALAASALAAEAQKEEKPVTEADTRTTLIEKSRGKPLTEDQRKTISKNIRENDEAWTKGREFLVPDGTEPDFVFRPTPLSGDARSNNPRK